MRHAVGISPEGLESFTEEQLLALLSPVRDLVLWAEIGYWIAEPLWGKGIGREAARAMADHAFEAAGYDHLVASYNPGNEASRRILEGLGFVHTGEAMSYSKATGSEKPVVRMALSRADWEDRKGRRQ